jgi:pimeloyl-ACP methyl ester carboxylesterase
MMVRGKEVREELVRLGVTKSMGIGKNRLMAAQSSTPATMSVVPRWVGTAQYPFRNQYFTTPHGKMHFIDEGVGEVILFVHGTPSWSFEYREPIRILRRRFRCVAADHLGFGLSDKPENYDYSLESHSQNLEALIDHLGLKQLTLVAGDFGVAIAMDVALRRPGLVTKLVLTNSWLWPLEEVEPKLAKQKIFARGSLMRFLYRRFNFSARFMVRLAWGRRKRLTRKVHRHYKRQFASSKERLGTWAFLEAATDEKNAHWRLWEKISNLGKVPVLVVWGMRDRFVNARNLKRWQEIFPDAQVKQLNDVGHFVADEAGELLGNMIVGFMAQSQS